MTEETKKEKGSSVLGTYPTPTIEEAYRLHYRRVFLMCLGYSHKTEDAEDLAQDIFLHLTTRLHHFHGEALFTTWLHRVATNYCLARLRGAGAKWRRDMASLEEMSERTEGLRTLNKALSRRDASLEDVVEHVAVEAILKELPARQCLMMELYLQGFTGEEIADVLDASHPSVKAALTRGRKKLAAELGLMAPQMAAKVMADMSQYL